jgi:SAM-dependent methyltransferase
VSETKCHRSIGTRSFAGISIHAGPGVHEAVLEVLIRELPPRTQVADLGAGSGAFAARLKHEGFDPVAVDMSVDVRPNGVRFVEADITDLGLVFEPDSLPAAVAIEAMEHLPNPVAFLESVHLGGLFLATTPNVTHPYSRLKFAVKGTFWLFGTEAYWSTGHSTPLPEWLLRAHLMHTGFENIRHGLIGSFDFRGPKALLVSGIRAGLRRRHPPLGISGDGSTLVMLASKPQMPSHPARLG